MHLPLCIFLSCTPDPAKAGGSSQLYETALLLSRATFRKSILLSMY